MADSTALPRHLVRELRKLGSDAYEAELNQALQPVDRAIQRWKRGEISAFEVSDVVHGFHNGPARKLWGRYGNASVSDLRLQVAGAISEGFLDQASVSDELMERLRGVIEFYSERREPG